MKTSVSHVCTCGPTGISKHRPSTHVGQWGRAPRPQQPAGRLTAGRAAVGPLPRVPDAVLHQFPLHVEGLSTLVTGEDLVGRVRLLVLLQVTEVAEA